MTAFYSLSHKGGTVNSPAELAPLSLRIEEVTDQEFR